MLTTIRIDKDLQQKLKIRSAETGYTQLQLANMYILNGLMDDYASSKPVKSLDEIRDLLDLDAPEGNGLDKFDGFYESEKPSNALELKKGVFK